MTASAALNEGVLKPTDLIDTSPGFIKLPGRKPITEDKGHNYGVLSFADVLIRSSNVGAVKMGWQVGTDTHAAVRRRVRIRPAARAGLPRRVRGRRRLRASSLNDSGLASVSMGYQVGVTPLQMVAAIERDRQRRTADGAAHRPRLRARRAREEIKPKVLRRVITPETAPTMTAIMEGVVADDTATGSRGARPVSGRRQDRHRRRRSSNGRYSKTDYNVSFVGFVPSRRPVFTILVVVDTPTQGPTYGGTRRRADLQDASPRPRCSTPACRPRSIPTPPIIVPTERRILPAAADARRRPSSRR